MNCVHRSIRDDNRETETNQEEFIEQLRKARREIFGGRVCASVSIAVYLIPAVPDTDPAATMILKVLGPGLSLVIPRLVAQEVNRNLTTPRQLRLFYRLFSVYGNAVIYRSTGPARTWLTKYIELGLPEKADAFHRSLRRLASYSLPHLREPTLFAQSTIGCIFASSTPLNSWPIIREDTP